MNVENAFIESFTRAFLSYSREGSFLILVASRSEAVWNGHVHEKSFCSVSSIQQFYLEFSCGKTVKKLSVHYQ